MGTTRRAVELPTEIGNGDKYDEDKTSQSPGRGERADGSSEIPDSQLEVRDR